MKIKIEMDMPRWLSRLILVGVPVAIVAIGAWVYADVPNTFKAGDKVSAQKMMENLSSLQNGINTLGATVTALQGTVNGNAVPPGTVVAFAGTTAPAGWAFCDGQEGRPDLRGRSIVGLDSTDDDYRTIRSAGGAKTHSHAVTGRTEMVANPDYGAEYLIVEATSGGSAGCSSVGSRPVVWRLDGGTANMTYGNQNCASYVGISGNAESKDNRPPYYTLAYIVKL